MDARDQNGMTETEFLRQYDPDRYEKPAITVDMLIFTVNPERDYSLELLMIERGGHPYLGKWALPGGFVEMNESLEEAAARELKEETGLSDIYMEQLFTFGDVDRDPRMRVISVAYMALVSKDKLHPVAGDDAANVKWFTIKTQEDDSLILLAKGVTLTEESIAFDHEKVIKTALQRLRNKVEYTDIAFELAGEKFTLTQLQSIYEAILGRKLHKSNFRRGIVDRLEKTEEKETKSSNRPACMYRKKDEEREHRF